MTAQEFLNKNNIFLEQEEDAYLPECMLRKIGVENLMEQYAAMKVLEALENEVPKAFLQGGNEWGGFDNESEYFDTIVKPKYSKP